MPISFWFPPRGALLFEPGESRHLLSPAVLLQHQDGPSSLLHPAVLLCSPLAGSWSPGESPGENCAAQVPSRSRRGVHHSFFVAISFVQYLHPLSSMEIQTRAQAMRVVSGKISPTMGSAHCCSFGWWWRTRGWLGFCSRLVVQVGVGWLGWFLLVS